MCMYAYMFVGVHMYIYMGMYVCGGLNLILRIIFGHLSQGFLIKPELADVSSLNSQYDLVILSLSSEAGIKGKLPHLPGNYWFLGI